MWIVQLWNVQYEMCKCDSYKYETIESIQSVQIAGAGQQGQDVPLLLEFDSD